MHPDQGIVRTDIRLDGISIIPENPKYLTHQYSGTDNAPREPLHGPVTWNPSRTQPNLRRYVYLYVYTIGI